MAVLFITHDFGVVAEIADRVAVMQQGRLVEHGPRAADARTRPQHHYTRALIAAVPSLAPRARARPSTPTRRLRCASTGLQKTYRARRRVPLARRAPCTRSRRELRDPPRRDAGHRRRIGLGQVHAGALHRSARSTPTRRRSCSTASRPRAALAPRAAAAPQAHPDGVPGSFGSLNPRQRVGRHHRRRADRARHAAREALRRARASCSRWSASTPSAPTRYPHEFSGGQRQRIGIARALALEPERAHRRRAGVGARRLGAGAGAGAARRHPRRGFELSMLFITHDLRVAAQVCDRIAVMRDGEIVEFGPTVRLQRTAASVHAGAVRGRSGSRLEPAPRGLDYRHRSVMKLPPSPFAGITLAEYAARLRMMDFRQSPPRPHCWCASRRCSRACTRLRSSITTVRSRRRRRSRPAVRGRHSSISAR